MGSDRVIYQTGIPEKFRSAAAILYEEAFGKKFSVAVKNDDSRRKLLNNCLLLEYAIGAIADGKLVGLAGFHAQNGSLTGGINYRGLLSQLGFLKGNWAALIFSIYERKPEPGEMVMDGIAVSSEARGHGVGSRLLEEIKKHALQHGYDRIRLDVINTNPRAKSLYERMGFKAIKTENFPFLEKTLGFGGVTTMEFRVDATT